MSQYKHTQIGYFFLTVYGAVLLIIISLFIFTDYSLLAMIGLIIMLIALGIFASMTVKISAQKMKIQLGLGAIRKHIPIKDIETYRVVTHPWYFGWGIRWWPGMRIFNVSGFDAVEIVLKNDKIYRIGTDEPDQLEMAIAKLVR